jgi:hypothetical protein
MVKKPKQKRENRDQQKQIELEGKKARLLERLLPENGKLPKKQKNPDSIMQYKMEWCSKQADLEGKWSWGQQRQWSSQEWDSIIKPNLETFSNLTWSEILAQTTGDNGRHRKHHDMEISLICTEAQNRWQDIELSEYDTIFRFRLGGRERLWGYRELQKFNLIWWDPTHQIYVTDR